MNETTFENAKVGDRVWDSSYGWGTIAHIMHMMHVALINPYAHPIEVQFGQDEYISYNVEGYCSSNHIRTLFWDEVKIEAPPRPVRKVKKVLEGWVNIYKSSGVQCDYETGEFVHATMDGAIRTRGYAIYLGEPLFIRHEYEVEE